MATISEIKRKARLELGGHIFGNMWLATLLACLIYTAIVGVSSYFFIGALLISGAMEYGISRVLIKTTHGCDSINYGDLFCGFNECFGESFLLYFLSSMFIAFWSLLFIVPGIIKSYSYSMAFFIQQEEENKHWQDCLDKSRNMMDGNKARLFTLDLSFIGWYLLGILCLGIGVFFVIPYHLQARACFYQEIKREMKTFGKTENN